MKNIKSEVRHWYNDLGDSFYAREYEDGYEITDRTKSVDYVRQGDFLSKEDFQNLIEERELESEPVYSVTSSAVQKIKASARLIFENEKGAIYVDPETFKITDKAGSVSGFAIGDTTSRETLETAGYTERVEHIPSGSTIPADLEREVIAGNMNPDEVKAALLNRGWTEEQAETVATDVDNYLYSSAKILKQHKGKANLSLYFTPEEIEALQPDEHGKPTRTYEEAGWVEDKPKEDWTEEFTESFKEDGSFDLTNPAMNLFLSDLQKSLDAGDYRSAIEQLHDMGYSPEDASDLVFDFKNGIMTPQELFSRVRLFDFLKSASMIRLNQNSKVLSVYADKINSHTSRCKAVQFKTLISSEVSSLKSCFELDKGRPVEFKPSNPEFLSLVSSLSRKEQNFKMVPFKPSVNISSRVFKSPAKSIFQNFQVPEAQNLLYKEIPCFELNF